MASSSQSIFQNLVKEVLNDWRELQLAVKHHQAGRAIVDSMVFAIETLFIENDGIEPYKIEDFLDGIFTKEFHLKVQDNSIQEVSKFICRLFHRCQEYIVADVQHRLQAKPVTQHCRRGDDEIVDELDNLEECTVSLHRMLISSQQHAPSASSQPAATSDGNMEVSEEKTDPDGWQVIRCGKRN